MPFSKSKRSTFNNQWLNDSQFSPWLKECEKDKFAFYCTMCKKTALLSNMGRQALTSHMKGSKHEQAARSQKSTFGIGIFLSPNTTHVPRSTGPSEWSSHRFSLSYSRLSTLLFCLLFGLHQRSTTQCPASVSVQNFMT